MAVSDGLIEPLPVTVSLEDLQRGVVPLALLEEAFGPLSLGIIIVKGLPEHYAELRHRLLSYSSYLASLSPENLANLENAKAKYLVGWSLGKETLKSGHYDTLKGSYYVNCAFYQNPELQGAPSEGYPSFPEYTAPNVWPTEDVLPGFKQAFEDLCTLVIDTAALVAKACDVYATENIEGYTPGYLEHVVRTSMTTKARLLHYFPSPTTASTNDDTSPNKDETADQDSWCATHVDHGCLTGLTSAMFIDESAHPPSLPPSYSPSSTSPSHTQKPLPPLPELPSSPSPTAGLYIQSRTGATTRVSIPRDCLAFQTGEALERITRGKFRAVPHFVRGVEGSVASDVARNTLAVFTQPNLWEVVDEEKGLDMAAFAKEIVAKHAGEAATA